MVKRVKGRKILERREGEGVGDVVDVGGKGVGGFDGEGLDLDLGLGLEKRLVSGNSAVEIAGESRFKLRF